MQNYAAIRIQAEWRKYITRETYLYVLHYRGTKANAIQATWRGYFSRKSNFDYHKFVSARKHQYDKVRNSPPPKHTGYSKILGKINVDQKREVENRAMNDDEAAVKMQASWRGYAGRKTLSHLTVPVHDDQANEKSNTSGL